MNKTITEMSIESRLTTTMLLVHKDKSAQENKSEAPEMRDDSECQSPLLNFANNQRKTMPSLAFDFSKTEI